MKPLNFMVVGSGWRSLFYARIAKAYPDSFNLTAFLCRTEEKAVQIQKETGIKAVTSPEECLSEKPDFIVVAVNKDSIFQVTGEWARKGYPVLCETPAAMKLEDLQELWRIHTQEGARIQVAEQYFKYPVFSAAIEVVKRGYLGEPYMVNLSAVHDYHGASLIRQFLGTGFENMKLYGKKFLYPVVETDSRYGLVEDGRISERERVRMTFEFEGGKTAFYDFNGIQYHSRIRSRHLNVQGARGELDDWTLRYAGKDNRSREFQIIKEPFETGNGIKQITMGQELLYRNPFIDLGKANGLPQDETAIGTLMLGMRRFIEEGVEVYPLAEGLQDAYVRILMEQALKSGQTVESKTQVWG
ncbi:Gfo/Idh/MocA family protein [Lacrimispora saccharolytica]|uniref:Oxidoreductase domain protein n=1 Tax=Lacrimispora saccharolytica (strain ATCC 35040 / DSM 2544 / NRCC 2533 / WM1) TaxID=610130 RepID=D9R318_LACSW|nr:Gfo/Idh/MocA family oxidoreductase [Lacrimispora saccharolytica]ADL03008.1 oxidoreductase domain protein [[Clostridium] saccharolyticum WM1]QRV18806.1 Gfo/Idh/MocA family oxidoreductase [Lacrimispora saccharolytica]